MSTESPLPLEAEPLPEPVRPLPTPPPLPPAGARTWTPPPPAPKAQHSAGLAVLLSLFPGLGQVYNGQPAKALVFFFGWMGSFYLMVEKGPLPFVFLVPFVYFYNLVDAHQGAQRFQARRSGLPEPGVETLPDDSPIWGSLLIGIGVLLLLNNLGWLDLARLADYWPVLLIVVGAVFLRSSLRRRAAAAEAAQGVERSEP